MITTLTYLTIIVFYLPANSVEKIVGAALHAEFCQKNLVLSEQEREAFKTILD